MPTQDWLNLVHQNLQSDAGAPMPPTPQFGLTPSINMQAPPPAPAPAPAPPPAPPPVAAPAPAPTPVQPAAHPQDGGIQSGVDALTPQWRMVSPGSAAKEIYTTTPNAERLHQEATQTAMQGVETAGGMRQQQANREADTIGAEYQRQQAELGRQAMADARDAAFRQRQFDDMKKAHDERTKQIKATVLDKNDSGVQTLGLIFSFLGGGFAGGAQALNSYIDKKIERDMRLQEFNYKAGLDTEEGEKNLFKSAVELTGSTAAAREAYKASSAAAWAVQLQQMAAQKRGTDEGAKIAEQAAQLMAQSQERQANAFKMSQASGARYQMLLGGQVLPGTFSEADAQKAGIQAAGVRQDIAKHTAEKGVDTVYDIQRDASKAATEKDKDKEKNFVPTGDGAGYYTTQPDIAKKHIETREANRATVEAIARIQELMKDPASSVKGSKAFGQLESATKSLQLGLKEGKKLGTLDRGSEEFLKGMTGDPTDLFAGSTPGKLEEIARQAQLSNQQMEAAATGKVDATSHTVSGEQKGWGKR